MLTFLTILTMAAAVAASPSGDSTQNAVVKHVVHISVDGLSSIRLEEALQASDNDQFPSFRRLIAEGVVTFNARTDRDYTVTLPNHTCILTGRPVRRVDDRSGVHHHGWTGNDTPTRRQTLHNQDGTGKTYIHSVFDVVHDHGLSTALYASKEKFILYEQSYNAQTGALDVTGDDDGRDKIDRFAYNRTTEVPETAAPLIDDLLVELAEQRFAYTFVHIRDPDSAGHEHGWRSTEWRDSVKQVDGYLARLFRLIESDDELRGTTALVLTTDHGGRIADHVNEAEPLNFIIPVFVWGPEIAAGSDLYELNQDTRSSPPSSGRDARPRYSVRMQPIRNGDTGNLALQLLGLPPVPGSMINGKQDLRVR